jgi:hypothetical protein
MNESLPLTHALDLFYGEASLNVAQLYARVPHVAIGDDLLEGSVHGPHSAYSRTLPFTVRFRDAGPGESRLLHAVLPDPCFWSPDLPAHYRVTITRRRRGTREVVEQVERDFSIRQFGTRQNNLLWENRRFVLRGVAVAAEPTIDWEAWREASTAAFTVTPSDAFCAAASREGVIVLAHLQCSNEQRVTEIRRLARWPAVAIVSLDVGTQFDELPRRISPNLLFAERFSSTETPRPSEWADLVLLEVEPPVDAFARCAAQCKLPVLAYRQQEESPKRAGCDQLQRDLAPHGDFAGYIVGGGSQ